MGKRERGERVRKQLLYWTELGCDTMLLFLRVNATSVPVPHPQRSKLHFAQDTA